MENEQYYWNNIKNLNTYEKRSFNRYFLHPRGKRFCSICCEVKDGIKENFNIKRYFGDHIAWDSRCRPCQSAQNLKRRSEQKKDYKQHIRRMLTSYKARAKQQDRPFDVTADYLIGQFEVQDKKCYYTREKLSFDYEVLDRNRPHLMVASIDKKDPDKGYVEGNVVWCLYYVNRMKNESTEREFLETCKLITKIHP